MVLGEYSNITFWIHLKVHFQKILGEFFKNFEEINYFAYPNFINTVTVENLCSIEKVS